MTKESPIIGKLVIVGVGLIGGSLAAAAKKKGFCKELIGVARRQKVCETAVALGIVDRAYTDIQDIANELTQGDVVFIAVPTLSMRSVLTQLYRTVSDKVIVTDGASAKGSVLDDVKSVYGSVPPHIVLGHPIAGSERSGVEASDADLYIDHRVILTPTKETSRDALEIVTRMWSSVGAEVLHLGVEEHDEILAATSHLPHAIAFTLVNTLTHNKNSENIFRYAAGGFRDFTRIASSDAVMWRDIMLANRDAVLRSIDDFVSHLDGLKQTIIDGDETAMLGVFTRAKAARDHFTKMLEKKALYPTMTNDVNNPADSHVDTTHVDTYKVFPGGSVQGTIRVPGDKSISHRSIMLGSLAEGVTEVEGFLEGEDALATLQSFRDMGVVIQGPEEGCVTIHGVGLNGLREPAGALYVGNSGTSMRLLSGILAGQKFSTSLTGDISLTGRPMRRVSKPLTEMGAFIETAENGTPPLLIKPSDHLKGFHYEMPVASAQVKSCLLLAGLFAEGETSVTEPAPTRDHTERMLSGFGYEVKREGSTVSLTSGGKLKGTKIDIPADISSATFFLVAAAITPDSDLTLTHVGINPTRIGVLNILKLMGANIEQSNVREIGGEPVADIRIRYAPLKGIAIPEDQVPLAIDEFPALFVAAACAEGTTVLTGAEELRVKESDRIQSMADGLKTLGISAQATEDGIVIEGGTIGGGTVESHHDHRIAMSFAIAGLRASDEIIINECANVVTSFPNFLALANQVGLHIEAS